MVPRLLADLGIERLVIVDDEVETSSLPAIEEVLGLVHAVLLGEDSPERQRLVAAFAELGLRESGDSWRDLLIRRWESGDDTSRGALATKLAALPAAAALSTIESWFVSKGPTLVLLTPEQWATDGAGFLDTARGAVVCLFDEDLGAGRTGTALMQAALAEGRSEDQFFFGLLTATIERSSEEAETTNLQHEVESDRVVVVSKDRAAEPILATEFADRLRIVVQATYHSGLRRMAKAAISDALAETTKRLDKLTVADFDRIVVETARREGTWEADELLRLVGIWDRSERRTHMLAKRAEIDQLLARVRVARPKAARLEPASPRVRELRRLELYAVTGINEAYLPIELGDVFSLGAQEYVLLIQACDMAVRTNGTRGRDPRAAPLAAIVRTGRTPPEGPSDAFYHLEYYERSAGKEAYIDLRRIAFLPLTVLDLVSFRFDGATTIDPTSGPPAGAFASMQERHRVLAKAFRAVLTDVANAEALAAEEAAAAESAGATTPGGRSVETEASRLSRLAWAPYLGDAELKLTPGRTGDELSFGLRRTARILAPHATAALTRFHQYRSRPAFEADFAREYPERLAKKDSSASASAEPREMPANLGVRGKR